MNYHKRQFSIYFAFDAGDNYLAAVVISGLETFMNTDLREHGLALLIVLEISRRADTDRQDLGDIQAT